VLRTMLTLAAKLRWSWGTRIVSHRDLLQVKAWLRGIENEVDIGADCGLDSRGW
jgi:hypothetical protein